MPRSEAPFLPRSLAAGNPQSQTYFMRRCPNCHSRLPDLKAEDFWDLTASERAKLLDMLSKQRPQAIAQAEAQSEPKSPIRVDPVTGKVTFIGRIK